MIKLQKITFIISIVLLLTISVKVYALGGKSFGGKVLNNKSIQIQALEGAGYECVIPGKTITIKIQGGSAKEFLIPSGVRNKSGATIRSGQSILGRYNENKIAITCTLPSTPPVTTTVNLSSITYFGTSK